LDHRLAAPAIEQRLLDGENPPRNTQTTKSSS
jgi:hypothetical protein